MLYFVTTMYTNRDSDLIHNSTGYVIRQYVSAFSCALSSYGVRGKFGEHSRSQSCPRLSPRATLTFLTCSPKIFQSRQSADIHEEAVKENEQKLANLSPAAEATSKDDVEIERFFQGQKSKNTQYKSDLNAWKKFL